MLIKILHMTFGALVILNFVVFMLMMLTPKSRTPGRMATLKKVQHVCYALVVLFGVWQLISLLPNNVPDWVWAKIILFAVAVSATAKAARAKDVSQMKVGLVIAAIAYIGIIWLVAVRPDLGTHKSTIENKPVSTTSTVATSSTSTNNSTPSLSPSSGQSTTTIATSSSP